MLEFSQFTKHMHTECLSERRAFGEKEIEYQDYLINNLDYLLEEYARQNPNKIRKKMDGFLKRIRMYSL